MMKKRKLIAVGLALAILPTLVSAAGVAGSATLSSAEEPAETTAKLPQTITVRCSLDPYAFKPNRKSWHIDQVPVARVKFDLSLKRHDSPGAMRRTIPGWQGSKTVDLKGSYTLRIDAHYLIRKPKGDFVDKPSGLTLDVSYFYKEKLKEGL